MEDVWLALGEDLLRVAHFDQLPFPVRLQPGLDFLEAAILVQVGTQRKYDVSA